jgi:hypothetical protein
MYNIGGDLREADFNKSDIHTGKPIEFREVSEKPHAVKDLRTEYRLLRTPHSELRRGRSERIQRGDRNVINRYDIPTTEVDWEAVNSVPMREKLSARANRVTERVHDKLFGGRSPLDEPETIGSFGINIKQKKKKKRSVSDKKLDTKMDNILYGNHITPKKKKSPKIKKDGWDEVLT